MDWVKLKQDIQQWGLELGFQQIGVSDCDVSGHAAHLQQWLNRDYHGTMQWMAEHAELRCQPVLLHPGTVRIISARMDYRPEIPPRIASDCNDEAQISCYASGRDYHKVLRHRLKALAERIQQVIPHPHRVFVDSAPVLERALAEKSGLGWIGKNTLLINKQAGSWFFLGELFTSLPLPVDQPTPGERFDNTHHCGTCTACLDQCPTQAIVAPQQVDARRCISYLTIEHKGSIPLELRHLMGNRIFGCDDCQVVCPWNKFSTATPEQDFAPRAYMQSHTLAELFLWDEAHFMKQTEGSPLRRVGHERWLRNIAIGLGNATASEQNIKALQNRREHPSALVREHVEWALRALQQRKTDNAKS